MNRRLIALIIAVVLAGVATVFLVLWVQSADERARQDEQFLEVFVAQADLEPGTAANTAISEGLIARDQIPARSVPPGAIGDLDQIAGLIVAAPVYDGEVIVAQRFGRTVATPAGLLTVPEGLQAVTVEAGVIAGVAGFVEPDAVVSVLATIEVPDEDAPPPPPPDEEEAPEEEVGVIASGLRTQFLVQNARVLAVGQRVVATEEGETAARIQRSNERYIFTLGMVPEDIEKLVFAAQQGQLWFTLLPEVDDIEDLTDLEELVTPGRTIENLFD